MPLPKIDLKVLHFPDHRLRMVSKAVDDTDYNVRQLVDAMIETMFKLEGAGLSAIQVGAPLRLFVIDGRFISAGSKPLTFINPEILERSVETDVNGEGCLSFVGVTVPVKRSKSVKVRAWNRDGKMFEITVAGYGARAIQHEYEHLDGKLLIDHLPPISRDIIKRKLLKKARDDERAREAKKRRYS